MKIFVAGSTGLLGNNLVRMLAQRGDQVVGLCVVDARDVAAAVIAALQKGKNGERYIVAGEYRSMEDLLHGLERVSGVPAPKLRLPHAVVMAYAWDAELFGKLTGRDVLITREAMRVMHAKHRLTSAKAERELGAPFRPLDETLGDVVAWYRDHPVVEITKAA